jgi:hypothetical protein
MAKEGDLVEAIDAVTLAARENRFCQWVKTTMAA